MNRSSREPVNDVRMRGFARRHTVAAALEWLDAQLRPFDVDQGGPLDAETVPLGAAAGRVLAHSVASDVDVPGFDRATMDGYAVAASSTGGPGANNPSWNDGWSGCWTVSQR